MKKSPKSGNLYVDVQIGDKTYKLAPSFDDLTSLIYEPKCVQANCTTSENEYPLDDNKDKKELSTLDRNYNIKFSDQNIIGKNDLLTSEYNPIARSYVS